MRIFADYHTHTDFSHGRGNVADNVIAAVSHGLSVIGICDHSVAHVAYGIRKRRLDEYLAAIDEAKKAFEGRIEVKSGLELNLTALDGMTDLPPGYDFDILILGYHKAVAYGNLKSAWAFYTGRSAEQARRITQGYMLALQKNKISIVAHPGYGVPVDYRMLGRACAEYGTLFEINNKHDELQAEAIEAAASEGARFVLSSDAHRPEDVGQVLNAMGLAQKAGLDMRQIANVTED